jgi:hypothetical protein
LFYLNYLFWETKFFFLNNNSLNLTRIEIMVENHLYETFENQLDSKYKGQNREIFSKSANMPCLLNVNYLKVQLTVMVRHLTT